MRRAWTSSAGASGFIPKTMAVAHMRDAIAERVRNLSGDAEKIARAWKDELEPEMVALDFRAQLAGNVTARDRILRLIRRYMRQGAKGRAGVNHMPVFGNGNARHIGFV